MTDSKGTELTILTSYCLSVNWQSVGTAVSIVVGVLAGIYYAIRIYKETFGGQN